MTDVSEGPPREGTLDGLKNLSLEYLAVQWIRSHCKLLGNEEADGLIRLGKDDHRKTTSFTALLLYGNLFN